MRRLGFLFAILLVTAFLGLNSRSTVHARFAELPDFWGINELDNGPYRWGSSASATCTGVTVGIGYPSQEKPGFIPGTPYYSVTWSLDQVLTYDFDTRTLVPLPTQLGDIYTFPQGTAANEFQYQTFNFNTPVPAGTAILVRVRYTINGEEGVTILYNRTGVFDIGDFDHPYWLMRANDPAYSTNGQFFCDAATANSAPTVYVQGDSVGLETDGSAIYNYTLFLDKASPNDIYVDLETPTGLNLPGGYGTYATFNGYSTRGFRYGSGVCLDSSPDCLVPDYTTVKISAGQTILTLPMTINGDNAIYRTWYESGQTVDIIRANNAYIGGNSSALFALREDEPCPAQPEICTAVFIVPDDSFVIEVDPVSFTVENIIVTESQQSAVFTVNLTIPNPYTTLNIAYATNSNGRNSTPDVDYISTSGTLTFAQNETTKQIIVPIPKDNPTEDIESFGLTLNKTGTYEGDAVEVGAIILNDASYTDQIQITGQPQDVSIKIDQSAQLSVTATAEGPLSYQWYAGQSGDTSQPVDGATSSQYTTPVLPLGVYDYWVQVYNNSDSVNSNTATVTVEDYEYLLLSEGFETDEDQNNIPDGWSLANRSKDRLICNRDTDNDGIRDKIFAHTGECAFRFRGVVGEKANLNLTINDLPAAFGNDDAFEIEVWGKTNNSLASRVRARVIVFYNDTTRSKANLPLVESLDYVLYKTIDPFQNDVDRIKIQLRSRAAAGKYYFDDLMLKVYTDYNETPLRMPDRVPDSDAHGEVIPLPDVPDAFRR